MSDSKLNKKEDYFEKYRETTITEVRIGFWQAVKFGFGFGIGLTFFWILISAIFLFLGIGAAFL